MSGTETPVKYWVEGPVATGAICALLGIFPQPSVVEKIKQESLGSWLSRGTSLGLAQIFSSGLEVITTAQISLIVSELKSNISLTYLNLADLYIGDSCWVELADVLATHNKTIRKIRMEGNVLRLRGAAAFAKMFRVNKTLTFLDIGDTMIPESGLKKIASALEENSTLQILSLYENIFSISACDAFSKMLMKNKGLTRLDLSSSDINCAGIEKLIFGLEKNSTLKQLFLSHLKGLDPSVGNLIARMISKTKIEETSFCWTEEMIFFQSELTGFENIGPPQAKVIANAVKDGKYLKNIRMTGTALFPPGGLEIARVLQKNSHLTSLDMSRSKVGKGGSVCEALCNALSTHKTITSLNLEDSDFIEKDALAISSFLARNPVLVTLILKYNPDIGVKGFDSILNSLKKNNRLETLIITENRLRDAALLSAGEMLKVNRRLKKLLMGRHFTGKGYWKEKGLITLFEGLEVNKTLKNLSIACDNKVLLTEPSIEKFVSMMDTNATLKRFDMQGCSVPIECGKRFTDGFGKNKSLKIFGISLDEWENKDLDVVIRALSVNTSLRVFELSSWNPYLVWHVSKTNHFIHYFGWPKRNDAMLNEVLYSAGEANQAMWYFPFKIFCLLKRMAIPELVDLHPRIVSFIIAATIQLKDALLDVCKNSLEDMKKDD